jgi:hypothetical protein
LMFGSPAAARSVGSQSLWAMISLTCVPGLMTPGQRRRSGTRCPPSHALLAVKRRAPAVRPRHDLRAVVGAINDDGVVRDAEIVELVEQLADHLAMLHHTVGIQADPGSPFRFLLQVRPDMHAGRVEPYEEGLVVLYRFVDKLFGD